MARAINLECAYLRRGFKLLFEAKPREISEVPVIKLLDGVNVREGFLNLADFEDAVVKIKDEDTRDVVGFLYDSAWRSSEVKTLEWFKINMQSGFRAKTLKTKGLEHSCWSAS